jgi:dephospho-CoA kinase
MKTIGLVGGVASGKSRVAQMLVDLGAGLLDADRAGHAVLAEDVDVQEALRARWGGEVFDADGKVDRAAVAKRVFADGPAAEVDRQFLEDLLHPRIGRRLQEQLDRYSAEKRPAAILDAALLFEAGWHRMCDVVLFIDAPRQLRLERAERRGWSAAEFARREAAQWPIDDKRRKADFTIKNDGTEMELQAAIRRFWDRHVGKGSAS